MLRFFILACSVLVSTHCANILGLMGAPSPSHYQFNSAIMHELGRRGHNVTVLSVDVPKQGENIPPNVHYIHLENAYKNMYPNEPSRGVNDLIGKQGLSGIKIFYEFLHRIGPEIYTSKGFHTLLSYPDDFKFDVVLYDYSKGPFLLGFLEKFNHPPLIGVTPFNNPPITSDLIGNPMFPGYIPHFVTSYDVNMKFIERIHNTLIYYYELIIRRFVLTPHFDKTFRKFYPKNTPYLGDLEKRAVLALVNTHTAVNFPEPLPPNIIEVGGLQITNPKPLPKDLDTFMNSSVNGVIYFSLGTNMKSTNLKEERIQLILDVMAQLPQYNFLWKMDIDETKFEVSKNVLAKAFFPQRDIFAHSKLKVFVTHSGGLSTQEAIWFGIPMIGMALFVDQPRNLHRSVINGVAAEINYLTLSAESLKKTILRVAEDNSFLENARKRSKLYRDQPKKPLDNAVWWVEYVIRNPNAPHLRSPALDLNFFVEHSLDVLLFLLTLTILLIIILSKLISFCLSISRGKYDRRLNLNRNKKKE